MRIGKRTYPEVIISCPPNIHSIPNTIRKQPRAKIPSKINGISSFPTERRSDPENQEEQHQWHQVTSSQIALVLECEDDKYQNSRRDNLGEDLARLCQERLRICVENARCGVIAVSWHCAYAIAFVCIDCGFVISVDNGGAAEAAKDLGNGVDGEFPPREATVDTICW